jgi:transposase
LPKFSDTKIRQALKDAGGNVKEAAASLDVSWSTFYRRLKAMREGGSPIKTSAASAKKAPVKKKAAASAKKTQVKKKAAASAKKAPVRKRAGVSAKKAPGRKKR